MLFGSRVECPTTCRKSKTANYKRKMATPSQLFVAEWDEIDSGLLFSLDETQIWLGDLRVVVVVGPGLSFGWIGFACFYGPTVSFYKCFLTTYSHKNRASERHRPNGRKKGCLLPCQGNSRSWRSQPFPWTKRKHSGPGSLIKTILLHRSITIKLCENPETQVTYATQRENPGVGSKGENTH